MKHALKFISMVALLVAALAMASCGNPNSSSSAQQRAVYVANIDTTIEGQPYKGIETITFESDGSFVVHDKMTQPSYEADVAKGTYTGNATVDGKITVTTTHMYNGTSLVPVTEIEGLEGANLTGEVTISNGKFTSESGAVGGTSVEYVRQ